MVKLLPPGFRFHPTDEELVVQYLKRKVESFPLPASIIPDLDVCKSDPWDLPGDSGKERYFFSTREAKYPNGNRSNRATISGYWKATGKDKPVPLTTSQGRGGGGGGGVVVVGMKKTLVFYRGKPPHGQRTDWIMHEYRLVPDSLSSTSLSLKTTLVHQAKGDWVLCRIFLKKRNNAVSRKDVDDKEQQQLEEEEEEEMVCDDDNSKMTTNTTKIARAVCYGFMGPDLNLPAAPSSSSSSSSSGSSAVTQISSANNNDSSEEREESSSFHKRLPAITRKP